MARNRSISPGADLHSRNSESPPLAQPQSKREKRRANMQDRLQEIVDSFNHNLRPHYEAQANAIQVDISLVLRADPFQNRPLEDLPEDIDEQIRAVVGDKIPADPVAEVDFKSQVGRLYSDYVRRVNDSMEERDINLNLLHIRHQRTLDQLQQRHEFQIQLAKEEHKLLSESIRERLVTTLTKKRERLLKEKEQLDIGDSNAYLLHPNQFSLINPSSPGGAHKRHTRGRGIKNGAEAEDAALGDKRKRKLYDPEPEQPSPALGPIRHLDHGNLTPFHNGRLKNSQHQHEAPAYSVDRLFTEKELQMTMNRAAVAASDFLVKLKNQPTNGTNGDATRIIGEDEAAEKDSANTSGKAIEDAEDDSTSLAATGMERTQSHHQTRGATRHTKEDLPNTLTAALDFPLRATLPTYVPAIIGAKANNAPITVATLPQTEVDQDLMLMGRSTNGDDEYNNILLERAKEPLPQVEFKYGPPSAASEGLAEAFVLHLPAGLAALGSVAMSKSHSLAGHEGSAAMGRVASSRGMKRTASSSNLAEQAGKRARARA